MGMSRAALWGALGNLTVVEPLLLSAYENEEQQIWREGVKSKKGYTSFHYSTFPGNDDSVCGRAQVYNLLHPAPEKPLEPKVRVLFDQGNDIEHMFIRRWSKNGTLLSADVTGVDDEQTYFEDSDCWLTGSPDAILLPPFWTKGHVVDVKTTGHEKVLAMRADPEATIYSHKKYVRQLKAYIAEANKKFSPTVVICTISGLLIKNGNDRCAVNHKGNCQPKILKVEPPDDGTLFYSSREEPLLTASYYITHDPDMFEAGKKKLKEWRTYYENDEIPPHVREGESSKWSVGDCKYCSEKKRCKVDYKEKRKKLSESEVGIFTKLVWPDYDYNKTRAEVLKRWQ